MRSLLFPAAALLFTTCPAAAQPPPDQPPPEEEAVEPPPPGEGATVEVNSRERELEREQQAAEHGDYPDQNQTVVDSGVEMEPRPEDSLDHLMQGSVRIGAGVPFVVGIKYSSGPRCSNVVNSDGDGYQEFCHRVSEPMMEVEAGFGATESLEVNLNLRFSFNEDEASLGRPFNLGVGLRAYPSPHGIFKVFFGARLVFDITRGDKDVLETLSPPEEEWSNFDLGFRGEFGLQVDPIRWLGFYAQLGLTIAVLRGFIFSPDITGGLQVRFP